MHNLPISAHGSGFVRPDRGQCRCIKAEIMCARAEKLPQKQRNGTFNFIILVTHVIVLMYKHDLIF